MTGFGARLFAGYMGYQAVHGRTSLEAIGHLLARIERRGRDYSKAAVSDWLKEKSDPSLKTFEAFAQLFGGEASWYAFGTGAAPMNPIAAQTQPVARPTTGKRKAK